MGAADASGVSGLTVDAAGVDYCNGAGAALLLALEKRTLGQGGAFAVQGLDEEFRQLVDLIQPSDGTEADVEPVREPLSVRVGRSTMAQVAGLRDLLVFVGHLTVSLLSVLRHPRQLRLKEVFAVAEAVGIGAVPIIAMVGFLFGLILAFQSAIPMAQFGAQIFVADLIGISTVRELGALMAAIMLTARSGSAFAAELGTMKINEEVDALTTMGLEPVRFLIVPRVVAAVTMVPVLTVLMSFSILAGGAVVVTSLGFPLVTYVNRVAAAVTLVDLFSGLFKAFFLGIVVAAVGCLRGLQTGTGSGAVGASATSAVVSGIILITVVEGMFAVVFYVVGI